MSAFRGQGALSREKLRLLAELAAALGLPADRHRAEVRRAANDDTLNTIAHRCDTRQSDLRSSGCPLGNGRVVNSLELYVYARYGRASSKTGKNCAVVSSSVV